MTDKQKELLELLREVDKICRDHQLRYVMAGGSMIGVLRNRGFVPWDDDIDIYMPQEDWAKFVEICKTEAPEGHIPMDMQIDREYSNSFPRYGVSEGCVIHRHQFLSRDVAAEIIDVLTLDPIPDSDKLYEKQYRENMMLYSELTNLTSVYGDRYEVPITRYVWQSIKLKVFGRDKTYGDLEKKMFAWKEEDCKRMAMRWGGCPFLFDKDMFFPTKDMPFEDMMVMVPARMSDYLIWHYGDEWAYVPPHGERESHDTVEPPNVSYQDFRAEYSAQVPIGKIRRHAFFRKAFQLLGAKKAHKADEKRKTILAKAVGLDLHARLAALEEPLEDYVKDRRYEELSALFAPYFSKQLSADFVGREDFANIYPFYHPILIPVEDSVFFAGLMTLLYTERVRWVDRLLKIYAVQKGSHPQAALLRDTVNRYRTASNDLEQGRWKIAYEAIEALAEEWPQNPSFDKYLLKLYYELWQGEGEIPARYNQTTPDAPAKGSMEEREAIVSKSYALLPKDLENPWKERFIGKLTDLLNRMPGDGYVEKYQADLLLSQGKTEEAIALYKQAVSDTNNGITWLEASDILREIDLGSPTQVLSFEERRLKKALYPEKLLPLYLKYKAQRAEHDGKGIPAFTKEEEELLLHYPEDNKEERAFALSLLGDICIPQGRTTEGFGYYLEAYPSLPAGDIKENIASSILRDLYRGEKRFRAIAARTDTVDFLDGWLDKYGDLADIQALAHSLIGTGKEKIC